MLLNEEIEDLKKTLANDIENQPVDKIQAGVFNVLKGILELGKAYPQIRFSLRKAIQEILRTGL
jgi:hypothetical protein